MPQEQQYAIWDTEKSSDEKPEFVGTKEEVLKIWHKYMETPHFCSMSLTPNDNRSIECYVKNENILPFKY